ncbi:TetR/AcrR family transcriptional regulator [Sphingobium sp. CFD-2]|uniref:TetR/AcrR family transcriptional regulator n=1 Tax=Sphingobium sp. CFD-2 TaxID=2878542 RepID=UPI00214CE1A3|nr:TetR/AcrR family transcriptional regulator [Sphingobium sp. CFD-2]
MNYAIREPVQQRSREVVARILQVTRDLLRQMPISQLTMNRVADGAEISVASIYRYYANKSDLIRAVQNQFLTDIADTVIAAIDQSEPKVEALVSAVVGAYDEAIAGRAMEFVDFLLDSGPDPELWRRGGEVMREQFEAFVSGLEKDRDRIAHQDIRLATGIALEIILGLFRNYARHHSHLSAEVGLPQRSRADVVKHARCAALSYLLYPCDVSSTS